MYPALLDAHFGGKRARVPIEIIEDYIGVIFLVQIPRTLWVCIFSTGDFTRQ
jgi:hypothetical protein